MITSSNTTTRLGSVLQGFPFWAPNESEKKESDIALSVSTHYLRVNMLLSLQ